MEGLNWAWLASVAAFAIAMTATPGPNNTMVAASGANFGVRASLPHLLGISVGFPVMLLAIGTVGAPLTRIPYALDIMKWIGIVYLLWLAWKIGSAQVVEGESAESFTRTDGTPLTFLQAALFQWVNPKAWIIAAGALVTYCSPTAGGPFTLIRVLVLGIVIGAFAFPSVYAWCLLGSGASRFLNSAKSVRLFNVTMALLLVASLVPLVLSELAGK